MSVLSIPKYARAKQKILSHIGEKSIEPGGRLPSEKEMSEMFEVSMITLRRALMELEADGVVDRVQGKGTFVKSHVLNGENLGTVGFLAIDQWTYPSPQQLEKLRKSLYSRGYGLRYYVPGRTPDNVILEDLIKLRGVLVSGWVTDEWLSFLDNCGVPTVVVGDYELSRKVCSVHYHWKKAGEIMTDHFATQGIRKLGLVCSDRVFYPGQQIYKGFVQACENHNIKIAESDIVWPSTENRENDVLEFLRSHEDDYEALIVEEGSYLPLLSSLWECNSRTKPLLGMIGEDIEIKSCFARITGIEFQTTVTEKAVDMLFSILDEKEFTPEEIEIEPVIRSS